MTHDDIQKEWDSFIEYPEGSDKLYVTTTSALLFARVIAEMAATAERKKFQVHAAALVRDARHDATEREREACAKVAEMEPCLTHTPQRIADAIRTRGQP